MSYEPCLARGYLFSHYIIDSPALIGFIQVALYFAFGQYYGFFLAGAAVFATLSWMYYGSYSIGFSVISCLWCIIFVEYWKVQQTDLAIRWGSRGVCEVKGDRAHSTWEKEAQGHQTVQRTKEIYQVEKQLLRQLPQFAVAILASFFIGSLVLVTFTVELLALEVYKGPFKAFIVRISQSQMEYTRLTSDSAGLPPDHILGPLPAKNKLDPQ